MGELIQGDFSRRPQHPRARNSRVLNLGERPADEPELFALSVEQRVQTAIDRELALKELIAMGETDEIDDLNEVTMAAERVNALLSPVQQEYVAAEAQALFVQRHLT